MTQQRSPVTDELHRRIGRDLLRFQPFKNHLGLLHHLQLMCSGLAEDMLNGSGDVKPGDFNLADVVPEADGKDIDEQVGSRYGVAYGMSALPVSRWRSLDEARDIDGTWH